MKLLGKTVLAFKSMFKGNYVEPYKVSFFDPKNL